MGVAYHHDLTQGTDEWLKARCGILTASELKLILTPTLKMASNDKERAHLFELLSQRINERVEPSFQGFDMMRGHAEEAEARYLYETKCAPVETCGFITNDRWGFKLGYSPDGLVGDDGLVEFKSRKAKFQVETIIAGQVPDEHVIQVQAALLISEREWLDFGSYSNGMPMPLYRVEPDLRVHDAILEAAEAFETRLALRLAEYRERLADPLVRHFPTIYTPPPEEMYT